MKMQYFVVMIEYPRREIDGDIFPAGCEAIVNPEITRRSVVSRVMSGDYPRDRINFIHDIQTGEPPKDITADILAECDALSYGHAMVSATDLVMSAFDRSADYRKHGETV